MPQSPYFMNQSQEALDAEWRFRLEAMKLPDESRLVLYEVLSAGFTSYVPTTFRTDGDRVIARQRHADIAFPAPIPPVKLSHILFGYEELLQRKYCLPGFVEVEVGDVVIDCGAYVGGFSLSAAKIARQLHAFEPDKSNFDCLFHNIGFRSNVICNGVGLFNEAKTARLNISASSVEHSLLEPDDGPAIETRNIQVVRLDDYCRSKDVGQIDFLKLEAEGVELEIFEGLGQMRPRKLAIDVSPERNGESPAEAFRERLIALGYLVHQRANVMFARQA